jgi:hypothetical protein
MDVDTIEPGVDFVRAIEEAVAACDVLIRLSEGVGSFRLIREEDVGSTIRKISCV